jgi:hypothetical protein
MLGITLFILFVLTITCNHKILNDYCIRKKVDLYSSLYLNRKQNIFLFVYSFSLLMIIYIFCIQARIFIIINNIGIGTLATQFKFSLFLSLSYPVIILILVVSTTLSWINVYNDKDKNGKFNVWFVMMACVGSSILGLFLLLALGIINFSYFNPLFLFAFSNYIMEIISTSYIIIMDSNSFLLSYLETSILSNIKFNFNFIYISNYVSSYYNDTKFYLSNVLGTFWHKYCISNNHKVIAYNYQIDIRFKYFKFVRSGFNGNIFQRLFSFIITLVSQCLTYYDKINLSRVVLIGKTSIRVAGIGVFGGNITNNNSDILKAVEEHISRFIEISNNRLKLDEGWEFGLSLYPNSNISPLGQFYTQSREKILQCSKNEITNLLSAHWVEYEKNSVGYSVIIREHIKQDRIDMINACLDLNQLVQFTNQWGASTKAIKMILCELTDVIKVSDKGSEFNKFPPSYWVQVLPFSYYSKSGIKSESFYYYDSDYIWNLTKEENFTFWIYNAIAKQLKLITDSLENKGHIIKENGHVMVNPLYKIRFRDHFLNIDSLNLTDEIKDQYKKDLEIKLKNTLSAVRRRSALSDSKITGEMKFMYDLCNEGTRFLYKNKIISNEDREYFNELIRVAREELLGMWLRKCKFSHELIFDRGKKNMIYLEPRSIKSVIFECRSDIKFGSKESL